MIRANCKKCGDLLFDCQGFESLGNRKITCRGCGEEYTVEGVENSRGKVQLKLKKLNKKGELYVVSKVEVYG